MGTRFWVQQQVAIMSCQHATKEYNAINEYLIARHFETLLSTEEWRFRVIVLLLPRSIDSMGLGCYGEIHKWATLLCGCLGTIHWYARWKLLSISCCQWMWMSVFMYVRNSTSVRLNISETKRDSGISPIGRLSAQVESNGHVTGDARDPMTSYGDIIIFKMFFLRQFLSELDDILTQCCPM